MGIARIRTVHRLELEAEIVISGFRIKGALDRQQCLIQQKRIGPVRKELTKIDGGGFIAPIECGADLRMAGYR